MRIFHLLMALALVPALSAQSPFRMEQATFGAGCFWCVEAVFERLKGVSEVESGYSGGHVANPTYRQVSDGDTGHAEVIRFSYDPSVITYEQLVYVFFHTHDPTTLNRQGADVGPQYRSVIYYHTAAQKATAERVMREVGASGLWKDPIVTAVEPLLNYYTAENYHQDYFALNPNAGYCQVVIAPKIRKFQREFAHLLKD